MGALKYLDYELFEQNNIKVSFIKYDNLPYPQLHEIFYPYVSIIDLIANCGPDSRSFLTSNTVFWKDFIHSLEAAEYL